MRMLIIGYCFGIRSERRLCEEVQLNLAYRWFCRLSIEDQVPDHSTFSKNRHGRFRDADTFRFVLFIAEIFDNRRAPDRGDRGSLHARPLSGHAVFRAAQPAKLANLPLSWGRAALADNRSLV